VHHDSISRGDRQASSSVSERNGRAPAELPTRLPPHNIEAEQGVLGSILLDNDVLHDVVGLITADDFYRTSHQVLYRAILDMHARGVPIDAITLVDDLSRRDQLQAIGGHEAISQVLNSVPHAANAKYYAGIVHEKAIARGLIDAANSILEDAYGQDATAETLLRRATERLDEIAATASGAALVPTDLGVTEGHTVKPEAVVWECKDRIARGKFFLLAGEGADGKSQIAIHLAAAYSTGGTLFGSKEHAPCRDVIFCQAEDGLNDTVVPRLIAAGADLVRIKFVKPSERFLARDGKTSLIHPRSFQDIDYWQRLLALYPEAGLFIADPIPAYIGRGVNDHRNADLRQVIDPFFDFMETKHITSLGITHVGKATDGRLPIHKILGSVAYANRARGAFGTGLDADDPAGERRLFCHLKPFNAKIQPTLAYKIIPCTITHDRAMIETSRVMFQEGTDARTAAEVMSPDRGKRKEDKAKRAALADWLRETLADGPVDSDTVKEKAKSDGFGKNMLWEVKTEVGVRAIKNSFTGRWAWSLPLEDASNQNS